MNIKLKEIDKDTLKVGDVVGVARKVEHGRISTFRHRMIISAKIIKITPKRTKIVSDKFGEHETILAEAFKILQDGIYKLVELRRNGRLEAMSDEDILEASKHMKAIMEITEKYRKE